MGDEAEKIILCAAGTEDDISEKMRAFLNYIVSGRPSDSFTNELENAVIKVREHIQWRQEYMNLLEMLEEERKEGREEGRKEERVNTEIQRKRAEEAEEKVKRLKEQLARLQNAEQ